jgi:hypothetical protein
MTLNICSLIVIRGLAEHNHVDGNKVGTELLPAMGYNYSKNLELIEPEMKRGNFAEHQEGIGLLLFSVWRKGWKRGQHWWWLRVIARGTIRYDVGRV